MKSAIRYFFKLAYVTGLMLLYGMGLIVIAFLVALVIGFFALDPSSIFSRILVIGIITAGAIVFLAGFDGIKHKVAAWRYLRSLPKVDVATFRESFPEYEESFLLEVRRIIATHLRIDEAKISSEIDFDPGAPLGHLWYPLYDSLFKRFRPSASPEIVMVSDRTAGIRPRPAHVVDFPVDEVKTLRDLLREIDQLKHLDISRPRQGGTSVNPVARTPASATLTKTNERMSVEEQAYLKDSMRLNPISKWISKTFFSYDETPIKSDLTDGVVEVCDIIVGRVAIGVENNDEGPIVFLEVGNKEILVLIGQWMCMPQFMKVSERAFAEWDSETSFFKALCLRRAPRTGLVLSLTVTDEELIPSERRIPREAMVFPLPLGDCFFMRGSLDTLEADFKMLASR